MEKLIGFIRKVHWQELLAFLFILVGVFFFRQEKQELKLLVPYIKKADPTWLISGMVITLFYILFQTGLFVYSFKTVTAKLTWPTALILFLKRNFISTFLPGGGVTALAYLPSIIRKENIERHKIFQGAGIQGIIGIISILLVGFPVILFAYLHNHQIKGGAVYFILVLLILFILVATFIALKIRGKLPKGFVRIFPASEKYFEEIFSVNIKRKPFTIAILFSIAIELTGILHLYISMRAVGANASWEAAITGYIISTLFLVISPFLKGLGAVELSLTYLLRNYGFSTLEAIEITLLYRFLEFWIPLVAGFIAWAWKGKNIILRLLPPTLILLLGIVNIFSVLTPPIASRMRILREYLPLDSIHASNWMIILIGLVLLLTASYLLQGLKSAWWLALLFTFLSLVGHLTKALDYEEAVLALTVFSILLLTKQQYRIKSSAKFINIGIVTALALFGIAMLFGALGFYYLNQRNFGISFSWQQSIKYAFNNFLLISKNDLHPITRFGKEFIISLKVLGTGSWIFLLYTIVRPLIQPKTSATETRNNAKYLLSQFGNSPVDYFKVDLDKILFLSQSHNGFIAYKIANGFAIVLEEPVCAESEKINMLEEFELLCLTMGLKPAFYRIDEDSLYYFEKLKKKKMLIGQEGIMKISGFSLEGRENKSLRNGLNSLAKKGFIVKIHIAPISSDLVTELKYVSDEWLKTNKTEMCFSQGIFNPKTIQNQDIIAVHDNTQKVVAFLNIIPDYAPDECTYDLIRKTVAAPGGCMDALLVKMVEYGNSKSINYLNLGMAPMSGIAAPENNAEKIVKYAYEKIKRYRHYQGLREFKEKYASQWLNKYLIYTNDFDLLQLPRALNKVMQPE